MAILVFKCFFCLPGELGTRMGALVHLLGIPDVHKVKQLTFIVPYVLKNSKLSHTAPFEASVVYSNPSYSIGYFH